MQSSYRFYFETPKALTMTRNHTGKRFITSRRIINAVRKGLSKAVGSICGDDQQERFDYMQALQASPKGGKKIHIQSAAAIPKWFIETLDESDAEVVKGVLTFVIEGPAQDSTETISQLISMAGGLNDVKLRFIDVDDSELDYELDDTANTYTIEAYLPALLAPCSIRDDREAVLNLVKKTYPIGHDPDTQQTLSKNIGAALKRHLIETAAHHGLNTEAINDSVLIVKAYWVAHPHKGQRSKSDRLEACRVTFQSHLKLNGKWFAGSYRHKGMGLIQESPELKVDGGVFIL